MEPSRPSPRKRLLQNLAISVATFLLCLAVAEGVLRLRGYGNLEIYQPDPVLYWKLKPNQNCYTKVGHKPLHVNAQGIRGPDFSPRKPPGTFRILSLGDSRTFGWGLSDEETYSHQLETMLRQHAGGSNKVEVLNAGINAWSYPQRDIYFKNIGLTYLPDVVLIGEANLWTEFSEKNDPSFVKKFLWRVRLKNFLRHFAIYHYVVEVKLRNFYERHRSKFIPVDPARDPLFKEQQQKEPEQLFQAALEDLCRVAQSNHVKPILLYLPTADDLTATNPSPISKIKKNVSDALGVPLVDLTSELRDAGKTLYLEGDSVHLDSRGNKLIAKQLFQTVTNLSAP